MFPRTMSGSATGTARNPFRTPASAQRRPADQLRDRTRALARTLTEKGPAVLNAAKVTFKYSHLMGWDTSAQLIGAKGAQLLLFVSGKCGNEGERDPRPVVLDRLAEAQASIGETSKCRRISGPIRQVPPFCELGERDIGVSGIGTIAAARVMPHDRPGESFVAVSTRG